MLQNVHQLLTYGLKLNPEAHALQHKNESVSYNQLADLTKHLAIGLQALTVTKFDRVGIYLNKSIDNVTSMLATSMAGGVFVPINPQLKAPQVSYIINDCSVKILITNKARLVGLHNHLPQLKSLKAIILTDDSKSSFPALENISLIDWSELNSTNTKISEHQVSANDMAAILYTSGSTGQPKGVVLSHQNIILGTKSVSHYLQLSYKDKILALLPFSFDYGLNQLTTALYCGATCVLHDFLFASEIPKLVEKYQITGIAGVPPLWHQLLSANWSNHKIDSLRYFTNSGGTLTQRISHKMAAMFSTVDIFAMYGLTEAFRSTYLPANEIHNKPNSIGKAIPYADLYVVREDGSTCDVNEVGELVHRGPLVSLGYWNKPELTQQRFKPAPQIQPEIQIPDLAVWSGDNVYRDNEGYFYFVERKDNLIKTSGYRVSPTEIEQLLITINHIDEVVVLGIAHPELGQAILVVATLNDLNSSHAVELEIKQLMNKNLASYMQPKAIEFVKTMPRNANQKIDRNQLNQQYQHYWISEND